jgi:hypothetical protein
MNSFDLVNEALRQDLTDYAHALKTIVTSVPLATELCDSVVKETRLAQALLAFANDSQSYELSRLAMRLSNLWPYRGEPYARTLGFSEEIGEAQALRQDALRGVNLAGGRNSDVLSREIATCFQNISQYLGQEQQLLEECHMSIQPHVANMELTRKRLQLLAAMVDARMPAGVEQQEMLQSYSEASRLLREWESGVPLNEDGVQILEHCVGILNRTDAMVREYLPLPAASNGHGAYAVNSSLN